MNTYPWLLFLNHSQEEGRGHCFPEDHSQNHLHFSHTHNECGNQSSAAEDWHSQQVWGMKYPPMPFESSSMAVFLSRHRVILSISLSNLTLKFLSSICHHDVLIQACLRRAISIQLLPYLPYGLRKCSTFQIRLCYLRLMYNSMINWGDFSYSLSKCITFFWA